MVSSIVLLLVIMGHDRVFIIYLVPAILDIISSQIPIYIVLGLLPSIYYFGIFTMELIQLSFTCNGLIADL